MKQTGQTITPGEGQVDALLQEITKLNNVVKQLGQKKKIQIGQQSLSESQVGRPSSMPNPKSPTQVVDNMPQIEAMINRLLEEIKALNNAIHAKDMATQELKRQLASRPTSGDAAHELLLKSKIEELLKDIDFLDETIKTLSQENENLKNQLYRAQTTAPVSSMSDSEKFLLKSRIEELERQLATRPAIISTPAYDSEKDELRREIKDLRQQLIAKSQVTQPIYQTITTEDENLYVIACAELERTIANAKQLTPPPPIAIPNDNFKISQLQSQIDQLRSDLLNRDSQLSDKDNLISELRMKLNLAQGNSYNEERLKQQILSLEDELREAKRQTLLASSQIRTGPTQEAYDSLQSQLNFSQSQNSDLNRKILELQDQLSQLRSSIMTLESQLAQRSAMDKSAMLQSEIERLERIITELKESQMSLRMENSTLKSSLTNLQDSLRSSLLEIQGYRSKTASLDKLREIGLK